MDYSKDQQYDSNKDPVPPYSPPQQPLAGFDPQLAYGGLLPPVSNYQTSNIAQQVNVTVQQPLTTSQYLQYNTGQPVIVQQQESSCLESDCALGSFIALGFVSYLFCTILGCVAMGVAIQAKDSKSRGDLSSARKLAIISIVCSVISLAIGIAVIVVLFTVVYPNGYYY